MKIRSDPGIIGDKACSTYYIVYAGPVAAVEEAEAEEEDWETDRKRRVVVVVVSSPVQL